MTPYKVYVNNVLVAEGRDDMSPLMQLGNAHGEHGDSIRVERGYFALRFTKGVHFMRFCPHPEEIDADVMPVSLLDRHPEYVVGKAVAKHLPFATCRELRDYEGAFTAFKGIGPAKATALDEVRRELRS